VVVEVGEQEQWRSCGLGQDEADAPVRVSGERPIGRSVASIPVPRPNGYTIDLDRSPGLHLRAPAQKPRGCRVQLDDIAGRKGGLRQVREEQFVDHAFACDPHWALFLSSGMRGHDHAIERSERSHRDRGAIIEAALHLTDRGRCWD
jgi:hypothetical protein